MKNKLLTVLLLLPAINIFAQHTFNSVEEAWNYALKNNPQDSVYGLKIKSAEKLSKAAHSYIFPKISAGLSFQKNEKIPETPVPGELFGIPGQTRYLQFGQKYNYNSSVTISKSILDRQSKYQYQIAELKVELSKVELQNYVQTLKEQVAQVYYTSLTANEAVRIGLADLAVSDKMLAIADARFEEGVIDSLTFNKAKINRNNTFEKQQKSKLFRGECMDNLKQLLGLEPDVKVLLTENISIGNERNEVQNDFPANKYTELLRLKSDISGIEVNNAKARFLPKINIVHYYGLQQYQDELIMRSSDWKANQYTAVSISIPVFTGFSNKAQYDYAVIEKQIAERKYEDELRKSAINDNYLSTTYSSLIKIAEISKETFNIALANVQLASRKYEQGIYALDDFLNIFNDYLAIENRYLNAVSEYLITKEKIEVRKNEN